MTISKELLKGSTWLLVLAVLSDSERYGYDIIKEIKKRSTDALELGEGTVYPILHALEKKKFVTSHWVKQEGAPDRKYYELTTAGKKALQVHAIEWNIFTTAVNGVLKKGSL